ncbi:MAG: pseudouridine synthase [Alphaproteobacteria bacterium]|nr:pseudouridine synthase [Alphaproteobacteria bacterium]
METNNYFLNKYVAQCGICSRRDAVTLIKNKEITVNGCIVDVPTYLVQPNDKIVYQKKIIKPTQNLVYILLNKPKDCITTTEDPQNRKTVMNLIAQATTERVFPVGRLDRNSTGVLLLTNDGDLTQKLTHPSSKIKKIYEVHLNKNLLNADAQKMLEGFPLEDGETQIDELMYIDPKEKHKIGVEIHSGKNRIIRRMFEHLGYEVVYLDRVLFGELTKKNLSRGKWRFLTQAETNRLKYLK